MTAIVLLILRAVLALALYAFLGWMLITLWRELKQQRELLVALQPTRLQVTLEGAAVPLEFHTPEVLIGRDPTCLLVLEDATVSAQHARLAYHHRQWWVEDLHSTNGTYLNDEAVTSPLVVTHGDVLRCGGVKMRLGF